jgi:hypothetical protein
LTKIPYVNIIEIIYVRISSYLEVCNPGAEGFYFSRKAYREYEGKR